MAERKFTELLEPRICVALTAYNDEESIHGAAKDFGNQKHVIKVIAVDNNSHDLTSKKASEAGADVALEKQQGYGFACIRGLQEALRVEAANIIVLCEGDGTFSGKDIDKLLPYLDNVDMVLGNRLVYGFADSDSQLDHFLTWGNWFLAKLIQFKYWDSRFWGKTRLHDVGCTFRMVRREALEKIIDQFTVGSYHFSPHMIMVAMANGLSVIEVPVTFHKRVGKSKGAGHSHLRATRIGLQMLWHIVTYRKSK